MFELCAISKRYGKTKALGQVDLLFTRGLYALLGRNGAGKTTLLRILTGNLAPDSGEVKRCGRSVYRGLREHRDATGYLPQEFAPYGDLTVNQFLTYMAGLKNIPSVLVQGRIMEVLNEVLLEGEVHTPLSSLSGGMRRQLGLAASVLNDPDLLVLDEPYTGLDALLRQRLNRLLQRWALRRTVIVSSHVTGDVEGVAEHVVILDGGEVRAFQRPEQMVLRLAGRVWEIEVTDKDQLALLEKEYYLPRIKTTNGGYRVRIVGTPPRSMVAKAASPQLEDVFLAVTGGS